MTRLITLAALVVAALLTVPVALAVSVTVLVPAVLAPVLGGADDQASPQPARTRTPGARPVGGRAAVLVWARARVGLSYRMGAAGPDAWDCSSFTQAAYAQVGVRMPRTAQQQRDWLAAGHGTPVTPGTERPADLIFWDSYLGPNVIGHVVVVDDPTRRRTVEAHNTRAGTGYFSYRPNHQRYEIWRPHLPGQNPPPDQRPVARRRPAGGLR
jgi:cell wall-associated NlpC family hydrolase